ncbi:hypothetical protein Hesp01_22980 [Herbidospora sp. NBRC 101105]|nr:hypothetical protein Hesp01_22980 [Herbidospora sp. NBRC 101105]
MWRLRGWWLLMIAASVGAVVSLLASSLPVLVGSVLVGTASAVAGAIAVRAEKMIEDEGAAPKRLGPRNVRVRDLDDPLALGVHLAPPVTLPDGTVDLVPGFVRRDASAELEDALRTSRFVLVVGESTAGKSRAAYEAMRACLPAHVFIRPTGREDLPEALARAERQRRCVVWLDELDLYLGVNGLTAPALSPLFADPGRHRVVLATMRSHERARYSPTKARRPIRGRPSTTGWRVTCSGWPRRSGSSVCGRPGSARGRRTRVTTGGCSARSTTPTVTASASFWRPVRSSSRTGGTPGDHGLKDGLGAPPW